ncbi:hypothetical protein JMJ35_006177 [Cladonia borealis]|uniref:Phosphoribosylglycinamide formyltransferase n=1 Tax=Cladonia borealis TaxID=184061 RepID=A0AA39V4Q5_9LECA|nr:hypothetical protein JMJ35_006177 [Cladonia borealis]
MSNDTVRITVMISGSGTNLQALIDATKDDTLPNASIIRVISNRAKAYGLERARNASIPTAYHNLVKYKKPGVDEQLARSEYDRDLAQLVLRDSPDLIICAGWMHVLAPSFLDPVSEAGIEVINLHPALPGQFDGANAISRAQQAWLDGQIDKTGVMIHKVIAEVDRGDPLLVKEIRFIEGVDEDMVSLEQRIHEIEHQAIVQGATIACKAILETKNSNRTNQDCYNETKT